MFVLRLPARFPLRFLLALLLGLLHSAGFLDDNAWPLQIAALAGLFVLTMQSPSVAAAGRTGLAFGLGWFLAGISWIFISLHTYGEMFAPLAALATFLLCVYLALFPALACAMQAWLATRWPAGDAGAASPLSPPLSPPLPQSPSLQLSTASAILRPLLLFAALWSLAEYLRGTLLTGFPWLASGYAHVGSPLAGYAPLLGVYGLSGLSAFWAGAIALLGTRPTPRAALAALICIVALPLAGVALDKIEWAQATGEPLRVRMLQGNIPQDLKFAASRFDATLDTYLGLIEQQPADLTVLPETALPRFLHQVPEAALERLRQFSNRTGTAIALGTPIADEASVYFNSVVSFSPQEDALQRYDKTHLVPFGEFIPYGFRWFVDAMKMPLGDFTRGATTQQPMRLAGQRVAFNICYEDLFGEEIIRQAGTATVLANVSNVAWFGDSLALPQHLQISRMRAIETSRPMLRATNTGMTAAIDPHGKVLGQLEPFTVGALDVTVQGMTGMTPYVRYGNAPALALCGLLIVFAMWPARAKNR